MGVLRGQHRGNHILDGARILKGEVGTEDIGKEIEYVGKAEEYVWRMIV